MDNTQLLALFPTPVLLIDNFISDNERLDLINHIKTLDYHLHGSLSINSRSTFRGDNECALSEEIANRIQEQIDNFLEILGISSAKLDNSWVNVQGKGSQLLTHMHPNSKVSGSLYLNVDENSSKLYFYNPNPHNKFQYHVDETHFNYDFIYIKPKNCQLVLFPSWLEHGSNGEINNTEDRTVISFNSN